MRSCRALSLAVLLCVLAAPERANGAEMWMPETGEVQLEDLPRESAEARRLHALALIGAGQWSGGAEELRQLLAADPQAEWAAEARFTIARGLLASGHAREAFDELGLLAQEFPDSPFAGRVRAFQQTAARVHAVHDPDGGADLYDRLIDTAKDADERAVLQRDKADAFFRARRYLDAEAGYLELMTLYPRSEWCAYAWYRAAECEWELARWLGLGLERMESAEESFLDFAQAYPTDVRAEEALARVSEVRAARATFGWEIARFYVDAEKKPWAAIGYLERIISEFPDAPEAQWATRELEAIRAGLKAPLRGDTKELKLPGVVTTRQEP